MSNKITKDLESSDPSVKMDMNAEKNSKPTPTVIIAPGGSQFAFSDRQVRILGFTSTADMIKAGFNVR